ncbi:hypothetical protein BC835DRAFT_310738 [Cytidiella melzeri]|nr:hypothetical protein BC835DRAFT_310738 [Cytidiella melzeri]
MGHDGLVYIRDKKGHVTDAILVFHSCLRGNEDQQTSRSDQSPPTACKSDDAGWSSSECAQQRRYSAASGTGPHVVPDVLYEASREKEGTQTTGTLLILSPKCTAAAQNLW